jgi:hypothetical protein
MPHDLWESSFKDGFIDGYLALADQFGVTLSGGDVSESTTGVVIDSIVLGEAESGTAVKRSGARVGDQIYVTGNLGGAAAGLKLIELGARVDERSDVGGQRSADDQRGSSPTPGSPAEQLGWRGAVREGVTTSGDAPGLTVGSRYAESATVGVDNLSTRIILSFFTSRSIQTKSGLSRLRRFRIG